MEKLTFRESRKFIEALKKRAVFLGAKGHEVRSKLEEQDLNEKVIIATSKKHRLILVATEEGFEGFHFNENELERYEILGSFDAYLQESYNFSIFEIDTQKLSLFLKSLKVLSMFRFFSYSLICIKALIFLNKGFLKF